MVDGREFDRQGLYRIRVKGNLDRKWSDWFDGFVISAKVDDETVLVGPVADQAALHGLLARIRDLGLPLLAVSRVEQPKRWAWIGSLAALSVIVSTLFIERGENPYLRAAGVIVLACAALFIFAPIFALLRHGRRQDGASYMEAETVVDRGLYAVVRHPQYLGYMLLAAGFVLLSQHWLPFVLADVALVAFYLQSTEEEPYCLARFGDVYRCYMQRVPRFNVIRGALRAAHTRRRHKV